MDLIIGRTQGQPIVTITDRRTNFGMMRRLHSGKDAMGVAKVVVAMLLPYKGVVRTITTDNGPEFARHDFVTRKLGVPVFFARPYHSWEKGAVENYNKLVRQYIPKKADFDDFSD